MVFIMDDFDLKNYFYNSSDNFQFMSGRLVMSAFRDDWYGDLCSLGVNMAVTKPAMKQRIRNIIMNCNVSN